MNKIYGVLIMITLFTACADPETKADPQGSDSVSGQTPSSPQNTIVTNSPPAGDTNAVSTDTSLSNRPVLKSNVNKDSANQ